MNFDNLKKQSKSFDKLLKEVEKIQNPTYEKKSNTDDNYWKPTPDKAGNALAVIRFLTGPAVDGEDALPWVQYWDHGFQNKVTGKWYIEKSLTSLGTGHKDPVSEFNNVLWGDQANRDPSYRVTERNQARDQKRRLHYVSNILVISDPKNPENEGKVFLFKYGKKIFDKLTKMMHPDLESEEAVNPFDLWNGAPFKLKMTRVSGYPNYDESTFLKVGPVADTDEEIERIWRSEYSLADIVDPKNYKTYDELKKRLDDVLGFSTGGAPSTPRAAKPVVQEDDDDEVPFTASKPVAKKAPEPVVEDEDDDEDLARFRKLIED